MPPNTTKHYDYTENRTPVESDIEDWTPENSGAKKLVDVHTYGNLPYAWPEADPISIPQRIESQWYLYWMQSMPGHGDQIRYGQQHITNWWIFTADWDAAIASRVGLFEQTRRGIGFTKANPIDLNADGTINILDLVLAANSIGETGGKADVNADGIVNILDLVRIANGF